MKLSLYENAIDSIQHGLDHLEIAVSKQSNSDYKSAILLIFQGVELILKEVVCQKNLLYIFDKNSLFEKCTDWLDPKIEELYNCKSLEITKVHKVAREIYPEKFNRNTEKLISDAARLRNRVQHFSLEFDNEDIKSILLRLYDKILSPCLTMIAKSVQDGTVSDPLGERLTHILCCFEIANQEEKRLKLAGNDFTRGSCFACGIPSLFIQYDVSYPDNCYCTSCGYNKKDIDASDFMECPECGAFSLLYCEKQGGGICLWYKCANHKDGGVITPMEWCNQCNSFKIEGECKCTEVED